MKTVASLKLKVADSAVRSSLLSVLSPDNRDLPPGLKLSSGSTGDGLWYRVESTSASTSLSTVLALLRDASLFQEVWLLSQGKDASVRRN